MKNMPLISVIVPVYNARLYLSDCITSVLSQNFKDFECILIDDGSVDQSAEICEKFSHIDKRILFFKKSNGGVSSAREYGVLKAKGKYICFLDSDDSLPDSALENLYKRAESLDLDILITAKNKIINSSYIFCPNDIPPEYHRNTTGIPPEYHRNTTGIILPEVLFRALLLGKCGIGPHGRLFKKSLFNSSTFKIPREITINEDLLMNLKLCIHAERIGISNDIVSYNYFHRPNSASSVNMPLKSWLKLFKICDELIKKYPKSKGLKFTLLYFKLRRLKKFFSDTWRFKKYHRVKGN